MTPEPGVAIDRVLARAFIEGRAYDTLPSRGLATVEVERHLSEPPPAPAKIAPRVARPPSVAA